MHKFHIYLFSIGCFTATSAFASNDGEVSDLFTSSMKALGALALVLALIFIVAWLAKRYLNFIPHGGDKGEDIRVI